MNKEPHAHWSFKVLPINIDVNRILKEADEMGAVIVSINIKGVETLFADIVKLLPAYQRIGKGREVELITDTNGYTIWEVLPDGHVGPVSVDNQGTIKLQRVIKGCDPRPIWQAWLDYCKSKSRVSVGVWTDKAEQNQK